MDGPSGQINFSLFLYLLLVLILQLELGIMGNLFLTSNYIYCSTCMSYFVHLFKYDLYKKSSFYFSNYSLFFTFKHNSPSSFFIDIYVLSIKSYHRISIFIEYLSIF